MTLPISAGILSWKSPNTLEKTLETYVKNDLFDLIQDVVILFQEVTDDDKRLADKFNLPFIGLDTNVGIGNGMLMLAEQARKDKFIFLEHDWQLVENYFTTKRRLLGALELIDDGYNGVRLRSRKNFGYPLYSEVYKGNELNHYDPNTDLISPHLFDCVHWINEPDKTFPDKIQKYKYHYVTTSRWSNWTNNPCLFNTKFLIKSIENFVSYEEKHLEPSISSWWASQNYKIAWGEGLFKHVDYDKWSPKE
jgi:hypothetical protein